MSNRFTNYAGTNYGIQAGIYNNNSGDAPTSSGDSSSPPPVQSPQPISELVNQVQESKQLVDKLTHDPEISLLEHLRAHWVFLCSKTTGVSEFSGLLFQEKVISEVEYAEIKCQPLVWKQLEMMYEIVVKKMTTEKLIKAWELSNNWHIIKHLNSNID